MNIVIYRSGNFWIVKRPADGKRFGNTNRATLVSFIEQNF